MLLTDSLGCPRDEIHVNQTWVDKLLLDKDLKKHSFYTQCFYSLSAKDVNYAYLNYLDPDIIICQIGIVDACRRALTNREIKVLSKIPIFGDFIHEYCRKKHYILTKLRNIHKANLSEFSEAIDKIEKICNKCLILIEIAPAGDLLKEKEFNVINDIKEYNNVIYSKTKNTKIKIIKPYSEYGIDLYNDYILENDGHHLNGFGNELVYKKVKECLLELY